MSIKTFTKAIDYQLIKGLKLKPIFFTMLLTTLVNKEFITNFNGVKYFSQLKKGVNHGKKNKSQTK